MSSKVVRKKHVPREMELTVVGMFYRVTPHTLSEIADSVPLHCRLEREPRNKHDENAVKVWITDKPFGKPNGDFHIGYIARQSASVIAPVMDADEWDFTRCLLIAVDEDQGTAELRCRQ